MIIINPESSNMEIWAILISIISLLITWYFSIKSIKSQKKAMMIDFFNNAFFELITNTLPNVLGEIEIDKNEKFSEQWLENFENILRELLKKGKFYKYSDDVFFKKFEKTTMELMNYIGELENEENISDETLDKTKTELTKLYENLYKVLFEYYYESA